MSWISFIFYQFFRFSAIYRPENQIMFGWQCLLRTRIIDICFMCLILDRCVLLWWRWHGSGSISRQTFSSFWNQHQSSRKGKSIIRFISNAYIYILMHHQRKNLKQTKQHRNLSSIPLEFRTLRRVHVLYMYVLRYT